MDTTGSTSHEFHGKVVLVTGASTGIGRAIVRLFAERGASVSMVARDGPMLNEVAAEIEKLSPSGVKPLIMVGSLNDETTVAQFVERSLQHFGRIDVLVNNAGRYLPDGVSDAVCDSSVFDLIVGLNAKAPLRLTRLVAPHLSKTKGSIVNISSSAVQKTPAMTVSYGMSKAALNFLTEYSAAELSAQGIRVNAISPGVVTSELVFKSGVIPDHDTGYKLQDTWGAATTAIGRVGSPAEVARAVLFLASEEASFVTGANLVVDGGARVKFDSNIKF